MSEAEVIDESSEEFLDDTEFADVTHIDNPPYEIVNPQDVSESFNQLKNQKTDAETIEYRKTMKNSILMSQIQDPSLNLKPTISQEVKNIINESTDEELELIILYLESQKSNKVKDGVTSGIIVSLMTFLFKMKVIEEGQLIERISKVLLDKDVLDVMNDTFDESFISYCPKVVLTFFKLMGAVSKHSLSPINKMA